MDGFFWIPIILIFFLVLVLMGLILEFGIRGIIVAVLFAFLVIWANFPKVQNKAPDFIEVVSDQKQKDILLELEKLNGKRFLSFEHRKYLESPKKFAQESISKILKTPLHTPSLGEVHALIHEGFAERKEQEIWIYSEPYPFWFKRIKVFTILNNRDYEQAKSFLDYRDLTKEDKEKITQLLRNFYN